MDRGTGFGRSGHSIAGGGPPGPPFALTSADNGLSVDPVSRRIVLGNAVAGVQAILLNDREIPFNGFVLHLTNAAGVLLFDPPQIRAQNATNSRSAVMEPQQISINSDDVPFPPALIFGTSNPAQTMQLINAAGNLKAANNAGNSFLSIFPLTGVYSIGDINASANGNFASVVDAANFFTYHNGADVWLNVGPGASGFAIGHVTAASAQLVGLSAGHLVYGFTGKAYLDLNAAAGTIQYKIGDINASTNGTFLNVNDLTQSFDFNNTTSGFAQFNCAGGEMRLNKPGTNSFIQVINSTFTDGLRIDSANNSIRSLAGTGSVIISPAVSTSDPGSGAGLWKLGVVVVAASVLDATRYVETSINGVIVKLAVIA